MTDDELTALKAICDAASPGPWCVDERSWKSERSQAGLMLISEAEEALYDAYDFAPTYEEQATIRDQIDESEIEIAGVMQKTDARFICRARSAMPVLIAELQRLRAEG